MWSRSGRSWRRLSAATTAGVTMLAVLVGCGAGEDVRANALPDAAAECPAVEAVDATAPADQVTYLTGFGDTAREGYVTLASQLGIFEALNLEVRVEAGAGLGRNLAELTGGAADFTVVDASGLFTLYVNGEIDSVQALAAIHQQYPMSLMAFGDSGITRPRDLNGRTIGLVPGSVGDTFWPTYARLTPGLDPATVEIVPTSNDTQTQELVAGQVDAIALFTMAAPVTESAGASAGRGEVTVLEWSRTFADLYGYLLVTGEELIATDPDLVERFTSGLLCGLAYLLEHPRTAAEILTEVNPQLDLERSVEELTLMREISYGGLAPDQPLGHIDYVRAARGLDLLTDAGEISNDFSHALPQPGGPLDEGVIHFGFVPGAAVPGAPR